MSRFQQHPLRSLVSKRCENVFYDEFTWKIIDMCKDDDFHPEDNPTGVVNMAIAENKLYKDILLKRLSRPDILNYECHHQGYVTPYGTDHLRTAAANYATDYFKAAEPLHLDNIVATMGVGAALDALAHVLGDPTDVFLLSTPCYVRLLPDLNERSQVDIHGIPLSSKLDVGDTVPFQLTARKVERAITECKQQGKNVKALLLTNPDNPTGNVLPEQTLIEILQVCKRHELHVVSNEIYGLSLWSSRAKFTSVVAIDDLPDPMRTHFIFGLSKDMGLSGFRIGFIHTKNPVVLKALQMLQIFSAHPSVIQQSVATLLNDRDWLDNTFFPVNHFLTRNAYMHAREWMKKLCIPFHESEGSFFIWADFRKFLPEVTKDAELELSESLLIDYKLALCPGTEYYSEEPGWFRILFTVPQRTFDEAMKRLQKCLERRHVSSSGSGDYTLRSTQG